MLQNKALLQFDVLHFQRLRIHNPQLTLRYSFRPIIEHAVSNYLVHGIFAVIRKKY